MSEKYIVFKNCSFIKNIKSAGFKVLSYMFNKWCKEDYVIFNLQDCKDFLGIKSTSYVYKGLKELLDLGIIIRGPLKNFYYINKDVFSLGKEKY